MMEQQYSLSEDITFQPFSEVLSPNGQIQPQNIQRKDSPPKANPETVEDLGGMLFEKLRLLFTHVPLSPSNSSIKREELKDDDILLFAQLDSITNNLAATTNDYQIVQEMGVVQPPANQKPDSGGDVLREQFDNKMPMNLSKLPQMAGLSPVMPSDGNLDGGLGQNTSHYVRYKLLDGKHVKIWECGILSTAPEVNFQTLDGQRPSSTTKEFHLFKEGGVGYQREGFFAQSTEVETKKRLDVVNDQKVDVKTKDNDRQPCAEGAKEFTHQYTLMRHLPTHTDERKFQCNTCGKAFRQMSTLSQHRAIHSTERPYICEICRKTFNRVSTLISHRKTHTGLKPHRCHLCTKAFHQKGNLRNHIFTHTNERPYKCDICSKGFNQMSNLMCHKLKAHQRTEKPKYVCQICGQSFPKRIGLRHHEQYTHGMITENIATPQIPEKLNLMNAIIVDPIKTEAMRLALESSQTPFALLRPLSGIPVLVRVLPAGEKQMLVPASAEDLKKHSHISITSKAERENIEPKNGKPVGSTVQIKIPVVATVIQQNDQGGQMSMSVLSPGPNGEFVEQPEMNKAFDNTNFNNFVYTSTLTLGNGATSTGMVDNDTPLIPKSINPSDFIKDIAIEFLDEQGIRLAHKENIKDAAVEEVIAGESTSQENCVEAIDINSSISDDTVVEMEIENNLF